MIQQVRIQNFKRFVDQTLSFKPLTLLTGLNSTGKSTTLQSLLLLRQSFLQGSLPKTGIALNGDLIKIGTATDAVNENAEKFVSLSVIWLDGSGKWETAPLDLSKKRLEMLPLATETASPEVYRQSLFTDQFQYLQAERLGPRVYLELSDFQVRVRRQLGSRGEFATHFLAIYGDDLIKIESLGHPEAVSLTLKNQTEAWLSEISPGVRVKFQTNSALDIAALQYSYGLSNDYRPTNVGFGLTYTLPIILAVMSAAPGALLLLENPEAHLHPKGQARIGQLLAKAAHNGVQVVIETHSDHILNGIRLAAHQGQIDSNDVQIHFFSGRVKDGLSEPEVTSPRLDRNGRIDQWPEDFFDEWDRCLEALLEPAGA